MKNMEQDILKVLIEENSIQERVQSLGAQISRDYEGKKLLVPVSYTHLGEVTK